MLVSNTIRFAADVFGSAEQDTAPFLRQGFLSSKTPFDCTNKSAVDRFVISGTDGKVRKFLFLIGDKIFKFVNSSLVEVACQKTFDDTVKYGNTVAELNALTSIPDFVGKKIYPLIALAQPSNAEQMPAVKLQLVTRTQTDSLSYVKESQVFELTQDANLPKIESVSAQIETAGAGSVDVKIKLRDGEGVWSDYMTPSESVNRYAAACQFKFTYKVTSASGDDSAQVKSVTVSHSKGKAAVTGNSADIFSVVQNYAEDLQTCYVTVRHSELVDSQIEAYANFMREPVHKSLVELGTSTGSFQTLTVPDNNIDYRTVEVFADGEPVTSFDFNSLTSEITLTVKKDKVIAASYDCDCDSEQWLPMTLTNRQPYHDDDSSWVSRYSLTLSDEEALNKKIANVRIRLLRTEGSVSKESLGKATGKTQLFVLKHIPRPSTIKFTNTVSFSYNENTNILKLTAKKNTVLACSYQWIGESITVYSWSAGWAAKL